MMRVLFISYCVIVVLIVGGIGGALSGMGGPESPPSSGSASWLLGVPVYANVIMIVLALIRGRSAGRTLVAVGVCYPIAFATLMGLECLGTVGLSGLITVLILLKSAFAVGVGLSMAAEPKPALPRDAPERSAGYDIFHDERLR